MTHFAFIGIDVSMRTLQISQKADNKEEDSVLSNRVESIEEWIGSLCANTQCVFEATGVYSRKLEYLLSTHGIPFSKVNPAKIKGFTHASGSLAKTDQHDARQIRRYAEAFQPQPDRPVNERNIQQARNRQALSQLEKQIQNIDNQIHVLNQEPLAFTELINSYHNIKLAICEEKTKIELELKNLETPEDKQTQKLLRSIPGIGKIVAQTLVATIDDARFFDNSKQLVKFLGLAPVEAHSGSSVHRKHGICRTAAPEIRAKLFMAATAAIRHNKPCSELFTKLRAKGKPKKVARVAVMHKMVRQVFAILKSNKPFNQEAGKNR